MNYDQLYLVLKNKWFNNRTENDRFKIQHFTDFLTAFYEEHKHLLSQNEEDFIRKVSFRTIGPKMRSKGLLFDKQRDGSDFKSVLLVICKILNQFSKNYVIMIDEVHMDYACRYGKADFSYLSQYKNCLLYTSPSPRD